MTHDQDKVRAADAGFAPPQTLHFKGPSSDQSLIDDPEAALAAIETFAGGGKGDATQIVRMARNLPWASKLQVAGQMEALAKRFTGDQVMQFGRVIGAVGPLTMKLALAARPALKADHLRRYLNDWSAAELARLADDANVILDVRRLLPGPLGIEIPLLYDLPEELHQKRRFVQWYIETTDKTVAALTLAARGTSDLAVTLDELDAWAWLDRLHVAKSWQFAPNLETLRDNTSNSAAKAKIQQLFGSFSYEAHDYAGKQGKAALREVNENEKETGNTNTLLDSGARAGSLPASQVDAVVTRLSGEPASVVFEFAMSTLFDVNRAIPLLAAAPGVTPDQLQSLLLSRSADERVTVLANDATRAQLRKAVGPRAPLVNFFPRRDERELAHETLYTNGALREWAYQEKNPETNLWVAAGSKAVSEACKLVKRELGSYGWVKSLPLTAPDQELRRLALNCGDEATATYIYESLLDDRTFKVDPGESEIGSQAGDIYGERSGYRLKAELAKRPDEPAAERAHKASVIERLGDLTATQRAALLQNKTELDHIFDELTDADAVRAVFLLGPTISQLLTLPTYGQPGFLDYIATRDPREQLRAAAQPASLANAKRMFRNIAGPHVVFPVLRDKNVLALALKSSPDLLEWILEASDPSFALAVLSQEPVRTIAVELFEQRPKIYDKLPAYQHLLPRGKAGFDAISSASRSEDTQDAAAEYRDGEVKVDRGADARAERVQISTEKGHLWLAIDELEKQHGTAESALAVVNNAPTSERVALLKGAHTASVNKLRKMVPLSPHHVFLGLTTQQLLALPDAASWMLDVEPSYALLSRLPASSPTLAGLARVLESDRARGNRWIFGLPDAAGLTAQERGSLDLLAAQLGDDELLRALFERRYSAVTDDTFKGAELHRLWRVLARLPPSQVNQKVIADFQHANIGAGAGQWGKPSIALSNQPSALDGIDTSYDDSDKLSRETIQQLYGLDEMGLQVACGDNGWIERSGAGFRVKPVTSTPKFDATVLHEVGHSVDTLLGERTDLIFGQGGWKAFGVDQFEEWATEMGGLVGLTGETRQRVIKAWKESLRAGVPIQDMVGNDHPARNMPEGDPLGHEAKAGNNFNYKTARHEAHHDRVFTTNGIWLYSVKQATAQVAPSQYSMSAPAEYFAECYVEYYREYQGTPTTASKKGGHLPPWIKKWFDTHVDNIRLSPARIEGKAADQPDASAKEST